MNTAQDCETGQSFSSKKLGFGGISGSTLKLVGIVTMLVDHIAAAFLSRVLSTQGNSPQLFNAYICMRGIGRLGFPIFCFLLVEGFAKTKNKVKYALRLGAFALISEIPFDLAFQGKILEGKNQNVFFTLLLGLLLMMALEITAQRVHSRLLGALLGLGELVAFMAAADFLKTDYAGMGVWTIAVMYRLRAFPVWEMAGGCAVLTVMNLSEIYAFFALFPVAAYNGKRGWKLKYVFYLFYPVHLLLLWLAAWLAGMGNVPAF